MLILIHSMKECFYKSFVCTHNLRIFLISLTENTSLQPSYLCYACFIGRKIFEWKRTIYKREREKVSWIHSKTLVESILAKYQYASERRMISDRAHHLPSDFSVVSNHIVPCKGE